MPDQIGNITVPSLTVTGTFPLTVEYGCETILQPEHSIFTFAAASANFKREQRFYLGPSARMWNIERELDETERVALQSFYESHHGTAQAFTFNSPLPDGTTEAVTVQFVNKPLLIEMAGGIISHAAFSLIEVNAGTGSGEGPYTSSAILERFPFTGTLSAQSHTIIPLVVIRPRKSGYPAIYLSDRRVTIDGQLYLPRLIWNKCQGIQQVAVGMPNVDPESDDVQLVFGNADRVMRQLADDVLLDQARVEISLFSVNLLSMMPIWTGVIAPGGWVSTMGVEFNIRCTDYIADPRIITPSRIIDRKCDRFYNHPDDCPWASVSGHLDTTNFPGADASFCDHGYDTANGCLAHGNEMAGYYRGIVAVPQSVRVLDNSTGFFGLSRQAFNSTSQISDSVYNTVLPIVVTDIPFPMKAAIIAGRDEGDFEEYIGIVAEGPITFASRPGHTVDGKLDSFYPRSNGRAIPGNDPAQPGEYLSLDQLGDQTGGDFRKVYVPAPGSAGQTFLNNLSAGVAAMVLRVTSEKGIQLTSLDQHDMEVWIQTGLQGYTWSAPGSRNSGVSLTNPVWLAANLFLRSRRLNLADAAAQETWLDIPRLIDAAAICDLVVPRVVEKEEGDEVQWKFIGVLRDIRSTRDALNDILLNCLGYYWFNNGKFSVGVRENASAISAYTDGNIIWRSLEPMSVGAKFTKLNAVFADAEYNFTNNSATFQDDDFAEELGGSERAEHTPFTINLVGTCDISPAQRFATTRGREEVGGINEDQRKAARRVRFLTTILALDTYPGCVISVTDDELPGGFGHFRVERWKLNPDYSVEIVARSVTPEMYDLVAGPKPADVRPGPIPAEQFADPGGPKWHPNEIVPDAADPLYGQDNRAFKLAESFEKNADGGFDARLLVTTKLPVNSVASNIIAPQVRSIDFVAGAGVLPGDTSYFVRLWMRLADGTFSGASNLLQIHIPAGNDNNKLVLSDIDWPAATSGDFDACSIALAADDARLLTWYDDVSPNVASIDIAGPTKVSAYNPPSTIIKRGRVKVKRIKHSGTNGAVVTAVDSSSITCNDLGAGFLADHSQVSRKLSVILDISTAESPLWDFIVTDFDPALGKFTVDRNPSDVGVAKGDVIVVRLKATATDDLTITDEQFVNGQYPNGMTEPEKGKVIYARKKSGVWQIRNVVSNTKDTYTIDRAWDEIPDADTLWFVADHDWVYFAETVGGFVNRDYNAEAVLAPVVNNFVLQPVLVGLFLEDRSLNETPDEFVHLQEIWVAGSPGTAGAIGFRFSPTWAPYYLHASDLDPLFAGEWTFDVFETYAAVGLGVPSSSLVITGNKFVNQPLQNCPKPVIGEYSISPSGGALLGGNKVFIQICAMDASNRLSPASDVLEIDLPDDSSAYSITLSSIAWPAIDGFNQYVLFASYNQDMICAQAIGALTGDATGYTPDSILLNTALERSTWAVPDAKLNQIRIGGKKLVHGGVIGEVIDRVIDDTHVISAETIDVTGADNWNGRYLILIGRAGESCPFAAYNIIAFDPLTGIYELDRTDGIQPGDVFVVSFKGYDNSDDPTSFIDGGISNASNYAVVGGVIISTPHSGLAIDEEKGQTGLIIMGKGRGLSAKVAGNSTTGYTFESPGLEMDETSVLVIVGSDWIFLQDGPIIQNEDYTNTVQIATPDNYTNQAMLIVGFTLDTDANISLEIHAPMRMVFVWGAAARLVKSSVLNIGLEDDVLGSGGANPDGTNAAGKYGNITLTGRPFSGSVSVADQTGMTTTPMILDIKVSEDGDAWESIFNPGPDSDPHLYQLHYTPGDSTLIKLENFRNIEMKRFGLARVDKIQSGGAKGISVVIEFGTPGAELQSV